MSTVAHPKQNYPTNSEPDGKGILNYLRPFLNNTVGAKLLVAITGLMLSGFVVGHLIGNLKIYSGAESLNAYAYFLKHSLGILIWVARGGLLVAFVTHIVLVLRLKALSKAARPIPYANPGTIQATYTSRYMLVTGLAIFFFLIYHLAHFTFGWVHTAADGTNYLNLTSNGQHDVYRMVIEGFRTPYISVLYIVAQVFLFLHLIHGFQSAFQTLGLNSPRFQQAWRMLGLGLAAFLFIGNVSIPLSVLFGWIQ